jgi:hypothetical protein
MHLTDLISRYDWREIFTPLPGSPFLRWGTCLRAETISTMRADALRLSTQGPLARLLARRRGFEPLTPRFVGRGEILILLRFSANQA